MSFGGFRGLAIAGVIATTAAHAGAVDILVTDRSGAPAANAVVTLAPRNAADSIPVRVPRKAVIDQKHETFIPLLVVVRKGGEVVFTNHDETMHQVYSFSPIKQFQFEIDQGQVSEPVSFEKPGVAAIGCNIHDNMVAYVFVADAPLAAVTDRSGRVEFEDVPAGTYRVSAWHPRLLVGRQPAGAELSVGPDKARLTFALELSRPSEPRMGHMHRSDY